MATLDIKNSQLRVKESAELADAIREELEATRAKVQEQEESISALLSEKTILTQQVAATQKAEVKLGQEVKSLESKLKKLAAKPKVADGNP